MSARPDTRLAVEALDDLATAVRSRVPGADPAAEPWRTDLLRLTYRLAFAGLVRRRGGLLDTADAAAGICPALDPAGLEAVAARLGGLTDDPTALGAVHLALLDHLDGRDGGARTARKRAGAWFTPPALVAHLLDETLEPALAEADDPTAVTVLDPACGSGVFLVAAARRLARWADPTDVVLRVHGVDRDAAAVELARVCLWLELVQPGRPAPMPDLGVRVGDALLGDRPAAAYDVVVGNPPFLNRLETRTATTPAVARLLDERAGGVLGPYTDLSAVFLHAALGWVREGGRVGLVQPQSLLAARDAAGVRGDLAARGALEALWVSDRPLFDASVLTCAPVLRRGAAQGRVRRSHGPEFRPVQDAVVDDGDLAGEWAFLAGTGLGIPAFVPAPDGGRLDDLAVCTADFRDQYYGLADAVREARDCPDGVPLVTTGLIDPAACRWGTASTRFLKRRWDAPVVDLAELSPPLRRWAESRLVPKVLVATQGAVLEAVVDEDGRWLPSVPTITVTAAPGDLWRVLAVLLAPPVVAHAATRYAGTALTMRAIKLSAGQVAALPLPPDRARWAEGAALARTVQRDADRGALHDLGRVMTAAYRADDGVFAWWKGRM